MRVVITGALVIGSRFAEVLLENANDLTSTTSFFLTR